MNQGLIIGSGIAGLAAAIFAKDHGLDVALYERDQVESLGSDHLLWIAPNGLHLLERLGLIDPVLAAAVPQDVMGFADRDLTPLMTLRGDGLVRSCRYPIVAIERRRLWSLLREQWARIGGVIHDRQALTSLRFQPDGVVAQFGEAGRSVTAPWIIGADGMGSKVRAAIAPDSRVAYQGIRTWLGRSETPVAASYVGRTLELWGQGTRFVLTSLDGRTVHWSALERSVAYESNSAPIAPETLARLQALFASYHPDVVAVLAAGDPASLERCNFGVVENLPQTYHNQVVLIGDAAHGMPPNMGQGASLGLEDALWLMHWLSRESSARAAFRAYDATRRKRVAEMRTLANAMNGLFQPRSKLGSLLRDRLAALVPDFMTQQRMGQLYQPSMPKVS